LALHSNADLATLLVLGTLGSAGSGKFDVSLRFLYVDFKNGIS